MLVQDPRPLEEKQGLLAQVRLLCSILFASNMQRILLKLCVSSQRLCSAGRQSLLAECL